MDLINNSGDLSGDQVPDPAPGHGTVPVGVGVKQHQKLKTDRLVKFHVYYIILPITQM